MSLRAIQTHTSHFLRPCLNLLEAKYNQAVGLIAKHTFQCVGQIQTSDQNGVIAKVGKIFAAILFAATLFPLIGLFIVSRSIYLLRYYGGNPAAVTSNLLNQKNPKVQPAVQEPIAVEAVLDLNRDPLLILSQNPSLEERTNAIETLLRLVKENRANKLDAIERGALPLVIQQIEKSNEEQEWKIKLLAIQALVIFATDEPDIRSKIQEAGAFPCLIECLLHVEKEIRSNASKALGILAICHRKNQHLTRKENAAPTIMKLLTDVESEVRSQAALSIMRLSEHNGENRIAFTDAIPSLVKLLTDLEQGVKKNAISALYALAEGNIKNQESMLRAGVISILKKLLAEPQPVDKEAIDLLFNRLSRGNLN